MDFPTRGYRYFSRQNRSAPSVDNAPKRFGKHHPGWKHLITATFPSRAPPRTVFFRPPGNSSSFAEKETRYPALNALSFPLDSFRRRLVR
jgi:hypothetical protein